MELSPMVTSVDEPHELIAGYDVEPRDAYQSALPDDAPSANGVSHLGGRVLCDMEGIGSFLDKYSKEMRIECASAFERNRHRTPRYRRTDIASRAINGRGQQADH